MKENKKPKKTIWKKRFIAEQILLGSSLALAVGFTASMIDNTIYTNNLSDLNQEKAIVYEKFESSEEFKSQFNQDYAKLSYEYLYSMITYDEFVAKLKYLNSIDNVKDSLETSNSELKSEVEQIDAKAEQLKSEYMSNPINIASTTLACAGLAGMFVSGIAFHHYDLKTTHKNKIAKDDENEIPLSK